MGSMVIYIYSLMFESQNVENQILVLALLYMMNVHIWSILIYIHYVNSIYLTGKQLYISQMALNMASL